MKLHMIYKTEQSESSSHLLSSIEGNWVFLTQYGSRFCIYFFQRESEQQAGGGKQKGNHSMKEKNTHL